MKFGEYYTLEQELMNKIVNEKKFSFRKMMMLLELKSLSAHVEF